MIKSSDHLCELLSPCCLELISKSVVMEILRVFISILFFSIMIEIVSLMIFSVITYFYPSLHNKELEENVIPVKENTSSKSVNNLFKNNEILPSYNFNFTT
jgi:hypothetical protein